MPVFPAVASTMVPPGGSFPSCSARRMMPMAARSFTLPPGFRYSSLAKTSAEPAGTSRFNCSMGVSPTSSVISSATRRWDISDVFEGTLQANGSVQNRQWNQPSPTDRQSQDQAYRYNHPHRFQKGLACDASPQC